MFFKNRVVGIKNLLFSYKLVMHEQVDKLHVFLQSNILICEVLQQPACYMYIWYSSFLTIQLC